MFKKAKIILFSILAVFSVGFLSDLNLAEAVTDSIDVFVKETYYQLKINFAGDGSGSVTTDDESIDCSSTDNDDCVASFTNETEVRLTAKADSRSVFSSWEDCDSVNGSVCDVSMDNAKDVTVTFVKQYYTVYFNSNGGTGTMTYQTFTEGVSEPLSENSFTKEDSSFAGWNTLPDGTGTSYEDKASITVSENITLYAQWEELPPEMEGTIIANPTSCVIPYNQDSCSVNISWSVSDPESTTAVTIHPNNTFATGDSGSEDYIFTEAGNETFYLYNNGDLLDQVTVLATKESTPPEMEGTIIANPTSCVIPYNQDSCSVNISWSVSDPESTTAVTIHPNNTFATGDSGSEDYIFTEAGNETFYLYNNGDLLDQVTVLATKESTPPEMEGTIIANPTSCVIPYNQDSCSVNISWSVSDPESTTAVTIHPNNTFATGDSGSEDYIFTEAGNETFYLYNNGDLLDQVTVLATKESTPPEMEGTIIANPTSCVIPYNQDSCSVNISWSVSDPESTTAVTIHPNNTFATGDSGSEDYIFTEAGNETFYLYNNGDLLDQVTVLATKESTPPEMEGTIIANPNPCQIAEGQSTCDTTIAWSVQNPISYTEVTTPVGVVVDSSIEDSGDVTYTVEHGGRTFYLYNSEELLGQVTVSPICEGGTSWLGSSCEGPKELIVSRNGAGTVTSDVHGISCGSDCSGVYAHGSRVTLTATVTEADNSMFSSWSGCDEVNGNTCTVLMDEDKNVTANFMEVWVDAQSSVEGSSIYNTIPNTIITIPYTTSSSLSPSECRLLDYEKLPLAEYYETDNPITLTSPSSSGSYKYYIQCRNQNNYNITAVSEEIIVNAVAVSVSLLKSFDTALPSSDYNFAFVPYSSPNVEYLNHVSCRLLDSDKNKLEPQDDTWISVNLNEPNGIYHKLPGGYLGSFGYYIRCRNDVVTIAEADSDKMTITTYCPEGKKLYEGICVAPGISASDCVIKTGESSCEAAINWEIPSLDGAWAITANIPVPNTTVVDIFEPNNIGQVCHTLPGVSDFPFFLYNDGVEFGLSRAYARCRPGTVWTFSSDGTTGTCEIMQNSIDVTICSISLGENSCQTEASWALDNIPPGKDINDFKFYYPKDKLVDGGGLGEDRKQTLYDVTLFHGNNDFKIFDGGDLIGEKNILGACVDDTEWDTESGTCVIKEPEINYFKAEPETIFKGQSTTLSWNFEEDRVDYCSLQKKLSIDDVMEDLSDIHSEDYNGSLEDSPLGTTIYYMTCYKEGSEPTERKEAIVSVIDMVIEEK